MLVSSTVRVQKNVQTLVLKFVEVNKNLEHKIISE